MTLIRRYFTTAPLLALMIGSVAAFVGCSFLESAKPVANTIYDVAKAYCAASLDDAGSESLQEIYEQDPSVAGLSTADLCEYERYFRPFFDLLLAGKDAAVAGLTSGGESDRSDSDAGSGGEAP